MQRFCLTLALRPDPTLVAAYKERHRKVPAEVLEALREAGVLDMQIYLHGYQLFMVMDTADDFSPERKTEIDRGSPAVMAWEREMARYQIADPDTDASGRWERAEGVFFLRNNAGEPVSGTFR